MQITRNETREEEVMDKLRDRPRLEGQHVTDAIRCSRWGVILAHLAAIGERPGHPDGALLRMERGVLRGQWMEDGEMSQIETMTPDDDSVGTIDLWKGFVVEGKSTERSINSEIPDRWILQAGAYASRAARQDTKTAKAELWIIFEKGDHGKKKCPDHGYPEVRRTELWEPTGRQRMICPECLQATGEVRFLPDGESDPIFRVFELRWTREELTAIRRLITERLAIQKTQILEYRLDGELPPILWGDPIECKDCPAKARVGCEGMAAEGELDKLADQLEGSILELEGATA